MVAEPGDDGSEEQRWQQMQTVLQGLSSAVAGLTQRVDHEVAMIRQFMASAVANAVNGQPPQQQRAQQREGLVDKRATRGA